MVTQAGAGGAIRYLFILNRYCRVYPKVCPRG